MPATQNSTHTLVFLDHLHLPQQTTPVIADWSQLRPGRYQQWAYGRLASHFDLRYNAHGERRHHRSLRRANSRWPRYLLNWDHTLVGWRDTQRLQLGADFLDVVLC